MRSDGPWVLDARGTTNVGSATATFVWTLDPGGTTVEGDYRTVSADDIAAGTLLSVTLVVSTSEGIRVQETVVVEKEGSALPLVAIHGDDYLATGRTCANESNL